MKKVNVTIDGVEYQVVGEREEAEIVKVAKYIDNKLNKVRESAPKLNKVDATILTSVNIVDQLFEGQKKIEELQTRIDSLKDGYHSTTEDVEKEFDSVLAKLADSERNSKELERKIKELEDVIEKKDKEIETLKKSKVQTKAKATKESDEESEKKIKSLEMKVKDMEKKVAVAESMATEFQNKAYNLQLNYEELKNEKQNIKEDEKKNDKQNEK